MNQDYLTGEWIEEDRQELQTGPKYQFEPSRREFVAVLGAGIVITVSAKRADGQEEERRGRRGRRSRSSLSDRLHISEDGTITVMTGKVEVGQDARTQVTQAACEELGVGIDLVKVIMGDTEICPNDGGTYGSLTTPRTIPRIRRAAAAARQILLQLAAKKLDVNTENLSIDRSGSIQSKSGKNVSIAELAKQSTVDEALDASAEPDVEISRVDQWQILGTSPQKVGSEAVVTGAKQYPSDIRRPEILFGKILRPPALGATLKSVDLGPAKEIDGVEVVRDGDFIGCAAESSYAATKAIAEIAFAATWDMPSTAVTHENLYEKLKETARDDDGGRRRRRRRGDDTQRGSVEDGMAAAKKSLSAKYEIAYIQHAPMEPRAAAAEWKDGKLTVWTGTQNPMRVRSELMRAFGLPAERARVIVPDTGGGFGGKHTGECALEAARLAKACKRPVSLRWTREEEFQWAYFRPGGLIETAAGLDAENRLIAWKFDNYNSGRSAIGTPYEVPNVSCESIRCDAPLPGGSYRALASTANNFARECFMDEIAAAAGSEPFEFRLKHLPQGRLRNVLEAAAERFGWNKRKEDLKPNQGIGLACGTEKGSYVAACVLLEIDRDRGKVLLNEVCQAFECGAIQNPVNLKAQVEGCLIMGLGGALKEEIKFADGKVSNGKFSSYFVPRMTDVPKLDTVLVNRPDLESAGAGETPIIAIAPAIANAVYDATEIRLRSMPLKPEKLKSG